MSDHQNCGGHHHHVPTSFGRAFAIGILLNSLFVIIEAFYGWKTNSLALLADASHNLSDVAGLILAWGGILLSQRPASARRTYGWKRATIVAAFANASFLIFAMGSLAWEAIGRLWAPEPFSGVTIMVVAAIGVLVNASTALLFLRGDKHDLNIRGAYLHMAADALVSVGVVVTGGLSLAFDWFWLDPVVSLAIASIILYGTWSLFRQSLHLLFDGVPDQIDLDAVRSFLASLQGVSEVHDLHIWGMSTSEIALTAHLVIPEGGTDDRFLEHAASELHDRFGIEHVTLQILKRPFQKSCNS